MGIQINGNTNNINAGIGSLSIEDINELDIVGVATAANFKTGVSNLHSVGLTLSGGQIDVGSNIKLGNAGVITATSFSGSGANLTGIAADKIFEGNTEVETVDTGSDGHVKIVTEGSERLRIDSSGNLVTGGQTSPTSSDNGNIYIKNGSAIGAVSHQLNYVTNAVFNSAWKYITSSVGATRIVVNQGGFQFDTAASGTAGNNITFSNRFNINNSGAIGVGGAYGSSGQVLTSAGSGSATTWTTISSDLVSDTSPQLGGDLDCNQKGILLQDRNSGNQGAVKWGDNGEMWMFHAGSDNTNRIYSSGKEWAIWSGASNDHACFKVTASDTAPAVELYYDNSKKLETTDTGIKTQGSGQVSLLIGSTNAGGAVLLLDGDSDGDGANADYSFIRHNTSGDLEIYARNPSGNADIKFFVGNGTSKVRFDDSGNLRPENDNDVDLGNSNKRWRNIYTNDLNLSNKGSTNSVDNTWGDYTIQEGESDLFLINNRNGKKYKFNLTEVS